MSLNKIEGERERSMDFGILTERERERERQKDRERERQTDRETDRQTERDTKGERVRYNNSWIKRERGKLKDEY